MTVTKGSEEESGLLTISAAWEVWSQRLHEVRRVAQFNAVSGDFATADQERRANVLLRLQHSEAYARARVQLAIAEALDGVSLAREFDDHWRDFWGTRIADHMIEAWERDHTAARATITDARTQAAKQSAAVFAALRTQGEIVGESDDGDADDRADDRADAREVISSATE